MALSYLSRTYKPDPYVQPLDLNLMAKVLSVEQGKFDQEGQKVQNQIDQWGSLDVIKGVDKEYINNKINRLVGGINDLGGVNLADQQVASNIEGMGSDIYGDRNIVNAVASTRQIRNLQSSYEKMKSDPKLAKNYSKVNEEWDNQFVSAYANDGKLGSTYSGPSSASPYSDYRSAHLKALEKIKANLTTNVTSDGLTFTTTEGKTVTPERVMAAAADLLLPDEKQQMEKDGWYAFKGANPLQVVQQSLDYNNQKLADARLSLNNYTAKALASAADPIIQKKYQDLASSQRNEVSQFETASKRIQSQGLQEYAKDPHGYMAQVYKDQYYRGLGERFATSETMSKVTNNPAALLKLKMDQEEKHFNQKMEFEALKESMKYDIDPITGKIVIRGKAGSADKSKLTGASLAPVALSNLNDPNLYKVTEQTFADQNHQIDEQKADLFNSYWQNYLNEHPELSDLLESSNSGTGVARKLLGQGILEGTNRKPGLQIEDFNFDPNNSPGIDQITKEIQSRNPDLSSKDARNKVLALKEIYNNFDKLSHIDHDSDIDVSKVDPKFANVVEQYQILNEKQNANLEKVQGVTQSIYKEANLSKAEQDLMNDYSKNPKKYTTESYVGTGPGGYGLVSTVSPQIEKIKSKLNQINSDKVKNEYYQNVSNRPVFESQIVTPDDPLVKSGYLPNLISAVLKDRGDDLNTVKPGFIVGAKDIEVTSAGRNKAGVGYAVTANIKTGHNKETGIDTYQSVDVTLDNAQAQQLGFNTDPYQPLNEAVYLRGSSSPLLIHAQGRGSKPLVAKIRIVKDDTTDRVGQNSHAQIAIQDKDGTKFINIPNGAGSNPSEAYSRMKTYINQFAQQGLTLEQITDQLLHPEKY